MPVAEDNDPFELIQHEEKPNSHDDDCEDRDAIVSAEEACNVAANYNPTRLHEAGENKQTDGDLRIRPNKHVRQATKAVTRKVWL